MNKGIEGTRGDRDKKKAPDYIGRTIAAGLTVLGGAGMPTQASEPQDGQWDADYSSIEYEYYEHYEPRPETLAVFQPISAELKDPLSITQEQVDRLQRNIDKFVKENPARPGKTEITNDGGSDESTSYSPYRELELALQYGENIPPLVIGFGMSYLKNLRAEDDQNKKETGQ